jgi:hypothetical protein
MALSRPTMGFATLRVPRVIPQGEFAAGSALAGGTLRRPHPATAAAARPLLPAGAPRARRPLLAPRRAPVHRARALRAAASASPTAPVTFRVAHRVAFGQVVKVVGEPQELGAWNAKDAPGTRKPALQPHSSTPCAPAAPLHRRQTAAACSRRRPRPAFSLAAQRWSGARATSGQPPWTFPPAPTNSKWWWPRPTATLPPGRAAPTAASWWPITAAPPTRWSATGASPRKRRRPPLPRARAPRPGPRRRRSWAR